jgi:hypothetical protein
MSKETAIQEAQMIYDSAPTYRELRDALNEMSEEDLGRKVWMYHRDLHDESNSEQVVFMNPIEKTITSVMSPPYFTVIPYGHHADDGQFYRDTSHPDEDVTIEYVEVLNPHTAEKHADKVAQQKYEADTDRLSNYE